MLSISTDVVLVLALLGAGLVYGTDAFCALVQRPALARVEDAALVAVMGEVHRFGDRRMPVPGVVGLLGAAVAAGLAAIGGHPGAAIAAAAALVAQAVWLVVYVRVSAPINRVLTAAADAGTTPADARDLQRAWDRVIVLRAVLQGVAVAALALVLVLL